MQKEFYNLTNPQKSIWLTEQFYQGSCVNNLCGTVAIDQVVDFDMLKKAIYQFVKIMIALDLNLSLMKKVKLNNKLQILSLLI